MSARELDAAGITGRRLRADYLHCRRLNARHGKTYFLATRLLPPERRPAVHALYGFARWADDIVDGVVDGTDGVNGAAGAGERDARQRAQALDALDHALTEGLRTGASEEPVVRALLHTVAAYRIDPGYLRDFMAAMRSDLIVTSYPTYAALREYTHGSAAVIGLQLLPVLGTVVPREEAAGYAAELGVAFQLTNFLRDVGEDLDRGRVYLPEDLLAAHGVDRALLRACRARGTTDRRVIAALREAEELTRRSYRRAVPGIAMLDPRSRPCVQTAFILYSGILDAVAATGYACLHRRAVVARRRRAAVGLAGLAAAAAARARAGWPSAPVLAGSRA
ncbi:phytoene/squalene synthase family protein [Streptomyces sp. 7-21]|uniref:phytoene/squalene synthase family protein n=1 Tax=Streptomyces sp. 7-21 TaxID=2802283 RepID=UPI00191FA146|nr:phytoene/squalene synthase family protein [Streptomyces sp. 7-21]MBL1065845.1 phytoene/squalene synthase family protein [Streptomyces sp. 7-21]